MRRRLFNIALLFASFCLMLSVSFGWWIEGVVSDSFIIKSAKISSEITIYQGNDFNHDGNLDKTNAFELLEKTPKGTKQVLILNFDNLAPTEVYTWKIKVSNNGDAAGFVYSTLVEELLKDKDSSTDSIELRDLVKFMSVTYVPQYAYYLTTTDGTTTYNGTKELMQYNEGASTGKTFIYNGITYDVFKNAEQEEYFVKLDLEEKTKVFLYDATATTALFGNTTSDVVDIGQSKEYVFQIQLEPIKAINDYLGEGKELSAAEVTLYQKLQGVVSNTFESISFEFLDVSLSSTMLGNDSATAEASE